MNKEQLPMLVTPFVSLFVETQTTNWSCMLIKMGVYTTPSCDLSQDYKLAYMIHTNVLIA